MYHDRTGRLLAMDEAQALDLFSDANRRVAETTIGPYWVSTVHLVIDHNHSRSGPPIIFETMVFKDGTASDEYDARYSTEREAKNGHENVVGMIRALESVSS